jgi:ABC-type phosphate/phosphonate transport system substrate-binding protein
MRQSRQFSRWLGGLAIAAGMLVSGAAAADYKIVAEPIYPPEKAQQVYKTLIAYLNKTTGEKFTLVTPRNYHFYWRDLKQTDGVDFAIDEAHLGDYRIQRFKYQPLVHAAEQTSYTLVTMADLGSKGLEGLVGKKIVSMPAPSLGYALLLTLYPNPIQQPDIESNASSWADAVEIVFSGEADAAIIPTYMKDTYPNLIPVKTSKGFPGTLISANPSVPDPVKQKVKEALLKLNADADAHQLMFELGVTKFVEASAADYAGSELVLKDFYGYQ